MQVTLDGFVAGQNGEMDWMVWNWDDELKDYVTKLTEPVDLILLGRKLAEGFIPHWKAAAQHPEKSEPGAVKFHETPKVVFSKSENGAEWENATVANGDLEEEVNNLKKQEGSDMIVYGGAALVSELIGKNLIDDYHLFMNPVVLGEGLPIFTRLQGRQNLKLIEARAFPCGIVMLHYQPA
jgi:dihydrofolate reductase